MMFTDYETHKHLEGFYLKNPLWGHTESKQSPENGLENTCEASNI